MPAPTDLRAMVFDVFGTVVDWRSSVAREAQALLAPKGHELDWGAFAMAWRARYFPATERVRKGERPYAILDDLHREALVELLAEMNIALDDAEIDELNLAWHRLDPWPDTLEGLRRFKAHVPICTLSNGNIALMVDMARHAGLPWDAILGAEVSGFYKPAPQAYDHAPRALRIRPDQCLFVAAHITDLEAGQRQGLKTAYVHRATEYGTDRARRRAAEGAFDIHVDSFTGLADVLGW